MQTGRAPGDFSVGTVVAMCKGWCVILLLAKTISPWQLSIGDVVVGCGLLVGCNLIDHGRFKL